MTSYKTNHSGRYAGGKSSTRKKAEWKENYRERFINPYNFIPLEGSTVRFPYKIDYKNTHTGYFDCTLDILTPLIIPNTSCDKAGHGELEVIKRGKEKHNPDGTGGIVKKYL